MAIRAGPTSPAPVLPSPQSLDCGTVLPGALLDAPVHHPPGAEAVRKEAYHVSVCVRRYPCDPSLFEIPGTGVWVMYGMQKTCADSGREFYSLGRYDPETHTFTLIDSTSDMGNNLWDGGEGYASQTLYDPRARRRIWTGAVIEGDRDPSDPRAGFFRSWAEERGWFGVLSLPRVVLLGNSSLDNGVQDLYLVTPPLPELIRLRRGGDGAPVSGILPRGGALLSPVRSATAEINATFEIPDASADGTGWDIGVKVFMSADGAFYTKVGVQDAAIMEGVDLWDEVNGDRAT